RKSGDATRDAASLLEAADAHLLGNYRPARMVLERGEGTQLFDTEGRRYLDFCAGVAVCCLGHGHPALTQTIAEQAGRLMQVSNYFYTDQNIQLAAELHEATGYDRAFFCNSGAEANEAMLKLARRHFHERGETRTRIITFERAFHGRTFGALALTGNPKYLEGFGEPLAGMVQLPYGDLEAVERALAGRDVAAVFVEPLQGEGGVNPAPAGFLSGLRRACDAVDTLLMLDEVQTGIGRTGALLASEHHGVMGDAVALAKGLGGGFPIGALLVREPLAASLPPGSHGSTYGGNPLACAVARTVLRVLRDEDLIDRAANRGRQLGDGLARVAERYPKLCRGQRGLGLMRAIVLTEAREPRALLAALREEGLLATAAGPRALRFLPPLVVTEAEVDEALAMLDRALERVHAEL
ncbi:MAG: aspartate aminotransferase family protein, partial [Myxococcota bacterium]